MDSGKRFEKWMSRSLHALDGASMRVEDGGGRAKNDQLCDFIYWPDKGGTIAIECKASKGRFELRRLGVGVSGGQLSRLLAWQTHDRKSVVALNFYGDDFRSHNRCILIPAILFLGVDGASITEDYAASLGIECQKVKLGTEYGYDLKALEDWIAFRGRR